MANIIQRQAVDMKAPEKKTMQQYIKSMEGEIAKALPSVITPERFTLHTGKLSRRDDDQRPARS